MAYAKRYAGGFVDKPTLTTPIDSAFLNAVESALLALFDANPASANMVPVWTPAGTHYVPQLITNASIDPAAAIAKSKLAALAITDADVAGGAAIARSKLNLTGNIVASDFAAGAVVGLDGWISMTQTLTYSSTDGPTFVVTTGGVDLTGVIPVGAKMKMTHAATTKYFVVTAINATTITLYGGANYTLAATAITSPSWSFARAPLGFPLDKTGWTETFKDATSRFQTPPVANTWYNPGASSLSIPIGSWQVEYECMAASSHNNTVTSIKVSLSTANNSESDTEFGCTLSVQQTSSATGAATNMELPAFRSKPLLLAAKTTYFLVCETQNASPASIGFGGTDSPTIIRAVCAYI